MIRICICKVFYFGLLIFFIFVGGGLLVWKIFGLSEVGYLCKVMKYVEELYECIFFFDSWIIILLDFGIEGNEFDKDGLNQFDLVKVGCGCLFGVVLVIFGWLEMWNGLNVLYKLIFGFVDEVCYQQEICYKIFIGMVCDFFNQVGIVYFFEDFCCLVMEGKFVIVMSMFNVYLLGDDLFQLDKWVVCGVCMFGFNYVGNNDWFDFFCFLLFFNDMVDVLGGFFLLGKQVVEWFNDFGVIIDVLQMLIKVLEQVVVFSCVFIVVLYFVLCVLVDIKCNFSDYEM